MMVCSMTPSKVKVTSPRKSDQHVQCVKAKELEMADEWRLVSRSADLFVGDGAIKLCVVSALDVEFC